jgi:hypothetical protein
MGIKKWQLDIIWILYLCYLISFLCQNETDFKEMWKCVFDVFVFWLLSFPLPVLSWECYFLASALLYKAIMEIISTAQWQRRPERHKTRTKAKKQTTTQTQTQTQTQTKTLTKTKTNTNTFTRTKTNTHVFRRLAVQSYNGDNLDGTMTMTMTKTRAQTKTKSSLTKTKTLTRTKTKSHVFKHLALVSCRPTCLWLVSIVSYSL